MSHARSRRSFFVALASLAASLAGSSAWAIRALPPRPQPQPVARCGDVTGPWSSAVDGLRARFVTSGSRPDGSSLAVHLELENLSRENIELAWSGTSLAFAAIRLTDAQGRELPAPGWAFGGNEFTGAMSLLVPAGRTARVVVASNLIAPMMGRRAVRIGAFYGRELPTNGTTAMLAATIAPSASRQGRSSRVEVTLVPITGTIRPASRTRRLRGTIVVPPVCVG